MEDENRKLKENDREAQCDSIGEASENTLLKDKRQRNRKQTKKKENENKNGISRGANGILHILQHVSLAAAAGLATLIILGSFVIINTKDGTQMYQMTANESGTVYEDSAFFNKLLGKSVSDIICYGAIQGQMETNGKFDPKKEVDITAYANRYTGIQSEYITARYYLDDLIKWAQNGFVREQQFMSGKEADEFLNRNTSVTFVDLNQNNYKGGTVSYLNSDLKSVTIEYSVSGNLLSNDNTIRDDVTANVLQSRYHSTEGKNIEKYVSSWEEYNILCDNLEKTAKDLLINYNEYLKYKDYYDNDSNVVYFIRKTIGDNTQVYTNTNAKTTDLKVLENQLKEKCGRYVIYDPKNMVFDTNTLIEESTLRYIVNGYEYSYPEDTQVMFGINTDYPASDAFSQGKAGYSNYMPYFWQYVIAVFICVILYLFLLVVLTIKEGKVRIKESGEVVLRLKQPDLIPTEMMLILGAFTGAGIGFLVYLFTENIEYSNLNQDGIVPLITVFVLLSSVLFSFFYYSFVRRCKAHTLWKNSMLKRIFSFIRKWILYLYDHAAVLIRVWIPFTLFVLLNIGLIVLLDRQLDHNIGIIIAVILDLIVGLLLYQSAQARQLILKGIIKIKDGDVEYQIKEDKLHGDNLVLAQAVNSIGEGIRTAVATSMKDERLKADLITNVSHDIKTPLTSIINYVDLIKRENVDNPKVKEYIQVLDVKSQRLKQLTDDLVEASKISSGNILLQWEKINLVELLNQTIGEFSEKFEEKSLIPVMGGKYGTIYIEADSRRIWRVIENLFNNIFKYALAGTRVYIDIEEMTLSENNKQVALSIKNISAKPLKVNPEELTERFIRGDESRTTEGSGLGLSIAKSLTEAQKGKFEISTDGDLFKVILTFPLL